MVAGIVRLPQSPHLNYGCESARYLIALVREIGHPLYTSTKCGRPLANATGSGPDMPGRSMKSVWKRDFEHCSVTLDLGCDIPSRDGCGTIKPKAGAVDTIKSDDDEASSFREVASGRGSPMSEALPPAPPPDISLKALVPGGASSLKLTPLFTAAVTTYTVLEQPETAALTLTATPTDSTTTMNVHVSSDPAPAVPLASGTASPAMNLTAMTTSAVSLQVKVTSADEKASRTYTVTPTFPPSPPATVGLKSVAITANGKPLQLVPAINSSAAPTAKYSVKVPDGVDTLSVGASTIDAYSTIAVSGYGQQLKSAPSPFASGGAMSFFLTSTTQTANFVVLGSDKKTTKTFSVQINSTVCANGPINHATSCPHTYQGAKCAVRCSEYFEPIAGSGEMTCSLKTEWQIVAGQNTSRHVPTWLTDTAPIRCHANEHCPNGGDCPVNGLCPETGGGGKLVCGLIPPPPLPKGGTWKCMNGSSSAGVPVTSTGNVTHNGQVVFNGTWFHGNPGSGCGSCDCCLDYISDCEACAKSCYQTPMTHFACGSPPPQTLTSTFEADVVQPGVMHPGPPPIDCVVRLGPRNPCVNSSAPGVAKESMMFATSRCDGQCNGVPDSLAGPFQPFPPATNGSSYICEAKVSNATSNSTNWRCNVCDPCCRKDVDCKACVKARCQPPGASFTCIKGQCVPFNVLATTQALFADPNCTKPLGGGAAVKPTCKPSPVDPNQARNNYKCFGKQCRLISSVYPLGEYHSFDCNKTCGKPPPPPPPPPPGPPAPPTPPAPPGMDPHSLNTTDPTAVFKRRRTERLLVPQPEELQAMGHLARDCVGRA